MHAQRKAIAIGTIVALLAAGLGLPAATAGHNGEWFAMPRDGSFAVDQTTNQTLDAIAYWDGTSLGGTNVGTLHVELYDQDTGTQRREDDRVAVEDTTSRVRNDCVIDIPDYRINSSDALINLTGDLTTNICDNTINGTLEGKYAPTGPFGRTYQLHLEIRTP